MIKVRTKYSVCNDLLSEEIIDFYTYARLFYLHYFKLYTRLSINTSC